MRQTRTYDEALAEIEELRTQLQEAQEAIEAIRTGQVDAVVVRNGNGHQLYTLKSADQTYRVFIEKMKEGAVTLDRNGIILYSNSQFASMIGLPLPIAIGMHFLEFVPVEFSHNFKILINKGWQSDSKGEIQLKKRNNQRIPVLLSFTSLELDEGKALSVILTDLTAQKETEEQLKLKNELLEEARRHADKMNEELEDIVVERTRDLFLSREHFRFLADNIPVIVWTTEGNGKASYFNKQWYEYTGLSIDDSKGDKCKEVLHPDDMMAVSRVWVEAIQRKLPFHFEYRIKKALDGTFRWHLVKGEPFKDEAGNIIAWFGTSTDIEDQKKEIEKKDEFISTASHELKTPLSSVKGYVQLIGRQKTLPETVNQYVAKANESITKLQHLINNLLDVSKIAAGKLKFTTEVFNLSDLVNSCVEDCIHMYGAYNIKSEVQPGLYVLGSAERLEQVLMNLISNAVKYSPDHKEIIVCGERKNDRVIISVQDFGIGLTEDHQKKVFERFFRVETGTFAPGLGIGLYISSEIIKEHNGRMQVQSKFNKGSTFSFSLALVNPHP
jgi:two-component system, OmpR family, phosphate regulon sensor histidine kinase PhoR